MSKKTDWFPESLRPHRPGVYETNFLGNVMFQHWNGKFWSPGGDTAKEAQCFAGHHSILQKCPWRGLAQNPEAIAALQATERKTT